MSRYTGPMPLTWSQQKQFEPAVLEDLFLSVKWPSAAYPGRLVQAMAGSHCVFSAWEDGRLAALANSLSDGAMAAYVHYLLVRPSHQGRGLGRRLVELMLEEYGDIPVLTLIAYDNCRGFYEKVGLTRPPGFSPLFRNRQDLADR